MNHLPSPTPLLIIVKPKHMAVTMFMVADLPFRIHSHFLNHGSLISDRHKRKAGFSFLAGDH